MSWKYRSLCTKTAELERNEGRQMHLCFGNGSLGVKKVEPAGEPMPPPTKIHTELVDAGDGQQITSVTRVDKRFNEIEDGNPSKKSRNGYDKVLSVPLVEFIFSEFWQFSFCLKAGRCQDRDLYYLAGNQDICPLNPAVQ